MMLQDSKRLDSLRIWRGLLRGCPSGPAVAGGEPRVKFKVKAPLAGLSCVFLAWSGAAAPVTAAESYTAETTYRKLIGSYPHIQVASPQLPSSVRAERDLVYVTRDTHALRLDLYLPTGPNSSPRPGIVFVHGGGWRVGVRDNFAPMAIRMAQQGYAAATITYRLADEAPYPAAVLDAKAAVRWMRARAAQYNIDPGRIAIAGGSAGGQIASLAGITGDRDPIDAAPAASGPSAAVQAIINIDGLSDFEAEVNRLRGEAATGRPVAEDAWFGGWFRGDAENKARQWREASPLNHVDAATPPMLFVGSAQPRFSVGRDAMLARLRAVKVNADVVVLTDTPHSFWLFDPWLGPTVDVSTAFLDRLFGIREQRP